MRVALVYDRVNKWGGAERVLLALHEIFPEAPLYTSVYDPAKAPWAKIFPEVIPSWLNYLAFFRTRHEFLVPLMPLAFESFNFDTFDLVISVTSEFAKAIVTKPNTFHLCYCLTPTRYLWSGYDLYFQNHIIKFLAKPLVNYLRKFDRISAQRPDLLVSISYAVSARVKKYYGINSEVIYPPVSIKNFQSRQALETTDNFFLLVSRLVPYKKVDLAIEAFNQLRSTLVIIGSGSEVEKLKKLAKDNIKFVGQLTDKDLYSYYEKCIAVIMPQIEDFGLVSLEAQAFGKPVIALDKGGVVETVINGKTGILFKEQKVASLLSAVKKFFAMAWNPEDCKQNAQKFSHEKFKNSFVQLINKYL